MSKTTYDNPASNISYTNKDFESIYPELLDLVKKLTNKWDPSLSNESDPGVLLIKELAILGDKLNYNIDKNVLECFPLSVTQLSNARKLYDELGYMMHWYRAAIGDIGFRLTKSFNELKLSSESFKIDQFTQLTNGDGDISYLTLNDIQLVDTSTIQYVPCIQGVIHDYVINGSTDITINNLDSDLRLYLPETMIAENGIFIKSASDPFYDTSDGWKLVDNLVSYESGSKVFKFGVLPNNNTCYIEFPQDIANIFTVDNISALNIKYVTTSGINGNVSARTVETITSELTGRTSDGSDISMNDNIKVLQPHPIINGKDIESLEEAYFNYKKTIGIFNTLVTRRDYNSFVYNAEIQNKNIVSNVVTADRTTDINITNYVQTWSTDSNKKELIILNNPDTNLPSMNAYDVNLYVTSPSISIYDDIAYNNTFKPQTMGENGQPPLTLLELNALIEDVKASQHDLRFVQNSDSSKFNINANYIIKGLLITYNKVTKEEAKEITANVKKALYEQCNNRELTYGDELAYDKLVNIIEAADDRIRTFVFTTLNYAPYMVTGSNNIHPMNKDVLTLSIPDGNGSTTEISSNYNNEMIARMVLAGNVQLFEFDENFTRGFDQSNVRESDLISTITTEANITIPNAQDQAYQVKVNEYVQAFAPSLIVEPEYSGDLHVTYIASEGAPAIPVNVDTFISEANGRIKVDNISGYEEPHYLTNCIVNVSTSLSPGVETYLGAAGSLKIKRINSVQLQRGLEYYLILNNPQNELILAKDEQKILAEGEYLIYKNIGNTDELVILGSGTAIKPSNEFQYNAKLVQINNNDFSNVPWQTLIDPLTVTEMDIRSFGAGVKLYVANGDALQLTNTPINLNKDNTNRELYYDLPGTEGGKLTTITGFSDYAWYVQSRLQVDSSPTSPQRLYDNQLIVCNPGPNKFEIEGDSSKETYVQFNEPLVLAGGKDINVQRLTGEDELESYLKAYTYDKVDNSVSPNNIYKLTEYVEEGSEDGSIILNYTFEAQNHTSKSYIIPVYTNTALTTTIKANALVYTDDQITSKVPIALFNGAVTDMTGVNSYTLQIPLNQKFGGIELTFNKPSENDSIYVGDIVKLAGFNASEIDSDSYKIQDEKISETESNLWNGTKVIHHMSDILKNSKTIYGASLANRFNWAYKVSAEDKILDPTSISSFWNVNHIYHDYTIPKIDFKEFDITVNPGNIL